jgi:hypothetical protein
MGGEPSGGWYETKPEQWISANNLNLRLFSKSPANIAWMPCAFPTTTLPLIPTLII